MSDANAILLLSCPDKKGIIASVSNFIFKHSGNIIHADQHTSLTRKFFFMRIEWELNGFTIPREEIAKAFEPLNREFDMQSDLYFTDEIPRVAIFVSRHIHCLHDLILRHRVGEFKAEIPIIISNHPDLKPLVEQFGLKFQHVPIHSENKHKQEEKILEALKKNHIDLIVLARYMQILSGKFVDQYRNRIINIHHSFLPAFAGGKPYQQAYDRGVKIIGATSHYVTETLDDGPIITQDVIKISHRDAVEDIKMKGKDVERMVLARAVRLHLEHRILVYGSKTIIFE
jgi:formyltetrahydrofolate deformylase